MDYCKKFLQRKVDVISLFSGVECGHAAWDMISQAALELWSIRTGLRFVCMVSWQMKSDVVISFLLATEQTT